ncbi:MAG: cation-translocating P-type ATPase [Promethearchaeati archaeon SRVP18_Atabeyarchaeia-1]
MPAKEPEIAARQGAALEEKAKWHLMGSSDVLRALGSTEKGLGTEEAGTRLGEYGFNEIISARKRSSLKLFLKQFTSLLMAILIIGIIISGAVDLAKNEFPLDSVVILIIVVASAALGFSQEYRAEQSMEALKRMAAPKAKVLRNGVESVVESREIVPGDVLVLDAGTKIPADARILQEANLRVDEAVLTGESTPVEKAAKTLERDVQIQDRKNMLFSSTIVTYGRAKAVVVATAMNTEFGKIATMLEESEKRETPLEERLRSVGRWLGIAFLFVVGSVATFGFLRGELDPLGMFIWAISLAVAAIPEALPAVVTGSLAIGMRRMARHNAIIRKLPAVETLGCATVICSDKTGTLTRNEMTVQRIFTADGFIDVTGVGVTPAGEFLRDSRKINPSTDRNLMKLLTVGSLCNDSQLIYESKSWRVTGDTTEAAILVAATKAGVNKEELDTTRQRVGELPFESERKRMSTIHPEGKGFIICVKGAPEIILDLSTRYLKAGEEEELSQEVRKSIMNANETMTSKALRVLGVAYRRTASAPQGKLTAAETEKELVFIGLVGMIDPPRLEAKEAVQKCKTAGIKVVMITGDHKLTAEAVARELGLFDQSRTIGDLKNPRKDPPEDSARPRILTGAELDKISEKELTRIANDVTVYARVSPEHKLRIVKALKANGHVVAMTGDGVNDAPALKNSDIGVAMGITGTDVTKEAADMVLSDDNFATIVAAVEEGRGIYDNIKKYLMYLLSSNVGEVLTLFIASVLGFPLPLIALQLLWVNLVTDGLPALALAIDPPEMDIMNRPPRDPRESIFSGRIKKMIFGVAMLMPLAILPVFYMYNPSLTGTPESPTPQYISAMTMAFTVMVMFEMFNVYTCRSEKYPVSKIGFFKNKYLNVAVLSSILLQLLVLYTPAIDAIIETTAPAAMDWLIILLVSCIPLLVGEIVKNSFPPKGKRDVR